MEGSETSFEMDWSETNLCLKCNGGGNLLVCSERTCLLAIHEGCMACPASFDDAGNFFCPYCKYREALAALRQANKHALASKKDLRVFTSGETIGCAKHFEEKERDETNRHDQPKDIAAGASTCDDSEGRCNNDCIVDQVVHPDEEHYDRTRQNEKIKKVGSEDFARSTGQQHPLNVNENEIHNADEENSQEKEPDTNSDPDGQHAVLTVEEEIEASSDSEGQTLSFKRQKIQFIGEPRGQDLSLVVYQTAKGRSQRSDPIHMDFEDVPRRSKHLRKSYKSASPGVDPLRRSFRQLVAERGKNVLNDKHDASTSSEKPQPQQPPNISAARQLVNHVGNDSSITRKSKRTRWRSEEEEMLKRGVEEFSQANRNIPWRKILGYGRDVFDENRTPSDLKEKWKTLSKSQIRQPQRSTSV